MPQIIVLADTADGRTGTAVMHRERVNLTDFESKHFASHLVERLSWAVGDAAEAERTLASNASDGERELAASERPRGARELVYA